MRGAPDWRTHVHVEPVPVTRVTKNLGVMLIIDQSWLPQIAKAHESGFFICIMCETMGA
jgi:hypothetical protein